VPGSRPQQTRLGALYVVGAGLCFALMSALIKALSADLSNEMLVWARNLFAVVFLLPVLARNHPSQWLTRHWRGHAVRVVAGLSAMYCMFWSIPRLNLAEALLLNHTATLFIPFIALAWLREPVSGRTAAAILLGFVGIVLLLKPGVGMFSVPAIVGLASGVFAAVAMVSIRSMAGIEPSTRIVFYFSFLGMLLSSVPLAWAWQSPTVVQWALLMLLGALAAGGQLLLTRGYMSAPAAKVGPFTYTSVLFAALLGWMLWDETLDARSWYGALLVIAAGVLIVWRRRGEVAVSVIGRSDSKSRDPFRRGR
jgi:drug/metabolite transporter (DMT)-like permease